MHIPAIQAFLDLNRTLNRVVEFFSFVVGFFFPEMRGFVSGRQRYLICYLLDFISKILKSWIAKKLLLGESLEKTPVIGN